MEGSPDRPGLTERQVQLLEAQFNKVYWAFLERKFATLLRPEIDHGDAANRVCRRFAQTIRKDNNALLPFIVEHGVGALKKHQYFWQWIRWETNDQLRKYYREQPDLGFDEELGEDGEPQRKSSKGRFVPLDGTPEPADEEQEIEARIDDEWTGNRTFLERIIAPLVEAGRISERDADIFFDRLSGFHIPDEDKVGREARQPTFREIGDRYGIGTTQVDRIVRKVMTLLQDPEIQPLIRKVLGRAPDTD